MKAVEKKETVQVFEFDKTEIIECFTSYLKGKNLVIPEKAQFAFEVKINPTNRDLEFIKLTTKLLEEGPTTTNGKGGVTE